MLQGKIQKLLYNELDIEVPSSDTNLLDNGYLDSLRFVQLMAILEEKFNIELTIDDLEFESFNTIENIALLVEKLSHGKNV